MDAQVTDQEISSTSSYVQMITGNRPCIMRPPTGATDDASCANVAAVDDGYPLIMWCVDTIDWQHHDVATTCDTIRSKVKDGAIVLMHDMEASSAQASQIIIPELIAAGYELVTVRFIITLIQRLDRHRSPLRFSQRQIRQLKHKCSNPRSKHKHRRQDNLKAKIRPKAHKLLNLHQILLQQAILQMTASRLSFRGRSKIGGQWPPYFSL